MSSGTYSGNLQIIRSTGVYGTEIREAIASVIEQADALVLQKVNATKTEINTQTANTVSAINNSINSVQTNCNTQINNISNRVDSRNIYMSTTKITGTDSDYLLTITNPS